MRLKSVLIAFIVLLIISRCTEKENVEPKAPVVEFSQVSAFQITGTVDLGFKVSNNKISSIQLFVDDVLLTDQEFLPPVDAFNFQCESRTVWGTEHQLKVVVEDAFCRASEQIFDIEFPNRSFNLAENK